MPWWVVLYFAVFCLFALATMTGELKNGYFFRAVVEAVPFFSSLGGAVCYWLGDIPSRPAAVVTGFMLALGVPLLVADSVVEDERTRADDPEYSRGMAVLTWVVMFAMFLPAYLWAALFVARAWTGR